MVRKKFYRMRMILFDHANFEHHLQKSKNSCPPMDCISLNLALAQMEIRNSMEDPFLWNSGLGNHDHLLEPLGSIKHDRVFLQLGSGTLFFFRVRVRQLGLG